MTGLIIVLAVMLSVFLLMKVGDVFSPWFLTTGVWLAILLLFTQYGHLVYPLEDKFFYCVWIWVPVLSVSSILTYYALAPVKADVNVNVNRGRYGDLPLNRFFFMALLLVSLLLTPVYLYKIYKVVSMFDMDNLFYNLRILTLSESDESGTGLLKYVRSINQALFIVAVWRYPKISTPVLVCIVLANLMCAIAIMEKGSIFFMIIITVFVLYEKGRIRLSRMVVLGVLIVFLFYGINLLRSVDTEEATENNTFMDFFSMYVLSPSVAFGQVQEKLTEQFGSRTFAFFYAVLSKLGIGHFTVEPKLQEFVMVPMTTNVYTVFQPFYEDFGYRGVAFFATVYGVFTGWLYRMFRDGGVISRCMYAYVAEILILQFFQENLILSLSVFFQYLIVFVLCVQRYVGISPHKPSPSTHHPSPITPHP